MPRRARVALLLCTAVFSLTGVGRSDPVQVRHREGLVHGFLILKATDGSRLASGDLIQTADGDRVTSRLVFHFHDSSLYDETTVFSERGRFRLISDHLEERGPSFPQAIDMFVDAGTGNVRVRYDDHGQEKTATDRLDPVPDLANGLIQTLLKNVDSAPPTGLSLVAATPKPRVVNLTIVAAGKESFETGDLRRSATHYIVKARVGGLTGAFANLLGKQPPDSHLWILGGEAPAFLKSVQPFYAGGPLWEIELVSPTWSHQTDR